MPQRPRLIANPARPLRSVRRQRQSRILAVRSVRDSLISVAGLVGSPVRNRAGDHIGRVSDIVARWDGEESYPSVTGLVVKIGGRRAFASMDQVDSVTRAGVQLHSARIDLMEFARREGEVLLGTLLRRLGPKRWRGLPTPERVIDWAVIRPPPWSSRRS